MCYIYQADLYCFSCGRKIKAAIGDSVVEDFGDSDYYPQLHMDIITTDTPAHCGSGADCLEADTLDSGVKVGVLLGNLTLDGLDYVRKAMEEGGEVAKYWGEYFSDSLVSA